MAVSGKWRDPQHPVLEVAVLRGLHIDQGYFESSVGAAIALTTALTLNTMQLFPELKLHTKQRYRRVLKKLTTEEAWMGLFKWVTDITTKTND